MTEKAMRHNKGFTLLELLIAISLMMIVMLMIQQMFGRANDLYRLAAERADVYSQARVALDAIETDLQRINPEYGDLILASHEPSDYLNEDAVRKVPTDLRFTRLPENDQTKDIVPLLAFFTTTSWQSPEDQSFESGTAQVVYYLRKRPDRTLVTGGEAPQYGGYLMRRVIPYRIPRLNQDKRRPGEIPPEEEIASSVLSARVYAYNNAAPIYMTQTGQDADLMVYLSTRPEGSARLLSDRGQYGSVAPSSILTLGTNYARPVRERTYSFGQEAGAINEHLSSRGELPLSIGIEITFVNDSFDMDASDYYGTLRTISRVIAVPNSQPAVFLSDEDLINFTR